MEECYEKEVQPYDCINISYIEITFGWNCSPVWSDSNTSGRYLMRNKAVNLLYYSLFYLVDYMQTSIHGWLTQLSCTWRSREIKYVALYRLRHGYNIMCIYLFLKELRRN